GCAFEQGWSGSVDVGLGHVSDKSYKFGEYTGLNKQGGFFIGDGSARFRGADAYYWNINASDLGLDSRSLDAEGGSQGKYKLFLKYDELPHYLSDSARTPFLGNGGASLTLPPGFPAATTGAMPLASTLQQVDLSTQRKRLAASGSWIGASDWEYAVKFSHETKDGMKRTGGAFFANAAQLVEPVDYVTDQVDASASYTGRRLQAKLAYYGSRFSNSNDALMWQNPFTVPATPGAVAGQLALAPDNQFHQFVASAGYQFSDRTRGSADIAWGRMIQNQNFLASTLNGGLAVPALPGSSLDGRAATLDANLKLTSAVTQQLRLNAIYTHSDRDNQTPQASYPSVSTDMFLGTPRTNLPYSFT
ncbi:MAG: MtrB/PioB family decaheme-associated outer membrane protein, partial [Sulfuricaulis sp.]|nr:MtrB/PioB family decaheme-associated outer membrane protein [Sulfuricaulis sp.]